MENKTCPCSKDRSYSECCEPFHKGLKLAPTAEALMRSRYSAFVVANVDYLESTLVRKERRAFDKKAALQWATKSKWLGLEIVSTVDGKEGDETGMVEFIAKYELKGEKQEHHEKSLFRKNDGKWLYVMGEIV